MSDGGCVIGKEGLLIKNMMSLALDYAEQSDEANGQIMNKP